MRLAGVIASALLLQRALAARAESQSAGCEMAASPMSGTYMLDSGGLTRTWRMHVPAGLDPATPAPVVLIFHG